MAMTGATIVIDDAAAGDTVLSVKQRVFAANRMLYVRRQRLMYRPSPRGMNPLADDETLGGAGVAQDGSAVIDILMEGLTDAEASDLDMQVQYDICAFVCFGCFCCCCFCFCSQFAFVFALLN
jgi:hypothetical protein